MNPRVRQFRAAENYRLVLTFTNGEVRVFDAKPYLSFPVFRPPASSSGTMSMSLPASEGTMKAEKAWLRDSAAPRVRDRAKTLSCRSQVSTQNGKVDCETALNQKAQAK
jgi:hypothetical protein